MDLLPLLILVLLGLGGLAAVVYLVVSAIVNKRPGVIGWIVGGLLIVLLLPFLLGLFFSLASYSPQTGKVARQRQVQRELATVQQQIEASRRQVEAASQRTGEKTQQSMQELWEKLNEPRIVMETQTEADRPQEISDEANETNESERNPAERFARLARLLATVATQVSDAASTVGRELIASDPTEQNEKTEPAETPETISQQPATAERIALTEHVEQAESQPATPRPAWVDAPPKRTGNTWREVVVAGEYATSDECYHVADALLLLKTYEHVQRLTGVQQYDLSGPSLNFDFYRRGEISADGRFVLSGDRRVWGDHRIRQLYSVGVTIDFIRREIAKDEYFETKERLVGEMKKLYTLVEFSPSVDRELRSRWDAYRRQERFAMVGVGAGSVLSLIGFVFGLLKVDTWTKGYYSKRLFLGVPAAIIGLIMLIALLNNL